MLKVVKVSEGRNIRSISDTLKKPALPGHYNIGEFTPSPKSNVLRGLVVKSTAPESQRRRFDSCRRTKVAFFPTFPVLSQ